MQQTTNAVATSRSARDGAMEAVEENAGAEWGEMAYDALIHYAKHHPTFMAEDVRLACADVPTPHDNRAWGPVFMRASRANIIMRVGYGQALTGHCRPMPVWSKVA